MKKRFVYTVRETLVRRGIVLAEDEYEANDIIDAARSACEIVLDSDDFSDYEIDIESDNGDYEYLDVWNQEEEK